MPEASPQRRPRGRPLTMSRAALLRKIQQLALRPEGLFRVHRSHPHIYARARRQFGSWADSVEAAGLEYPEAMDRALLPFRPTRRS